MYYINRLALCSLLIHSVMLQAMKEHHSFIPEQSHSWVKVLKRSANLDPATQNALHTKAIEAFKQSNMSASRAIKKYAAHKVNQAFGHIEKEWGLTHKERLDLQEMHKKLVAKNIEHANQLIQQGAMLFFETRNGNMRSYNTKEEFAGTCPRKNTLLQALNKYQVNNMLSYKEEDSYEPLKIRHPLITDASRIDGTKLFHQVIIECNPTSFSALSPLAQQGLCAMEICGKVTINIPTMQKLVVDHIQNKHSDKQEQDIVQSKSVQKLFRTLNNSSFLSITSATGPATHDHVLQLLREYPIYGFIPTESAIKNSTGDIQRDHMIAHDRRIRDVQVVVNLLKREKELLNKNK